MKHKKLIIKPELDRNNVAYYKIIKEDHKTNVKKPQNDKNNVAYYKRN